MQQFNIRYKDSIGNILSASQLSFFNYSKCRNKNKELLVCYHGSPSKFDRFKKSKIGTTNDFGMYGPGFYFTNKRKAAIGFGSAKGNKKVYLYKVYLNIKHPFIIKDAITEKEYFDMLTSQTREALIKDNINPDVKGLNLAEISTPNYREQLLKNMDDIKRKYDGVLVKYVSNESGDHFEQYIVFHPNQVKLIGNKNPSNEGEMKE